MTARSASRVGDRQVRTMDRRALFRQGLRSRTAEEIGSISAFVAVFAVAAFALMGLVVDGGSALVARQSAADEAEQAARAGAGALSVDALRSGSLQLDQAQAIQDAKEFTIAAGHPGTVSVSGGTVSVSVHYVIHTQILGIIGVDTLPISASASAVDLQGVTSVSGQSS
jgi:hypothetical protein